MFNVKKTKITKLFNEKDFVIPSNQRKYIWNVKEIEELYDDLFHIKQDNNYSYFISSFVFSKNKARYEIIDGQQRIITISLLICGFINQLYIIGKKKEASNLRKKYLMTLDCSDFKIKRTDEEGIFIEHIIDLLENEININDLEQYFNENFNKNDLFNKNILQAYKLINSKVSNDIKSTNNKYGLIKHYLNIIDNCEVIEVIVKNSIDGFLVFETLNARGLPLENLDLVKNYIFSNIRKNSERNSAIKMWNEITNNLIFEGKSYFKLFLSHYCIHIYNKDKNKNEFNLIKENNNKSECKKLIKDLKKNSLYYKYIICPEKVIGTKYNEYNIFGSLEFFNQQGIRQVRPALMSAFERFDDKTIDAKKFARLLKLLENFWFMYSTVCHGQTHDIDKMMYSLSVYIHNTSNIDFKYIVKELSKYTYEKDRLYDNFSVIGYSRKNRKYRTTKNKYAVQYVIKNIESSYYPGGDLIPNIQSIEHILNDDENKEHSSYIGNLLPYNRKANSKIGNASFKEKLLRYKESDYKTVKRFINMCNDQKIDKWGLNQIKNRGKELADYYFKKICNYNI